MRCIRRRDRHDTRWSGRWSEWWVQVPSDHAPTTSITWALHRAGREGPRRHGQRVPRSVGDRWRQRHRV